MLNYLEVKPLQISLIPGERSSIRNLGGKRGAAVLGSGSPLRSGRNEES